MTGPERIPLEDDLDALIGGARYLLSVSLVEVEQFDLNPKNEKEAIHNFLGAMERLKEAIKIRRGGSSIAPSFPDGSEPPTVLTSKQIIYLRNLLHGRPAPEGSIEEQLGQYPARKCSVPKADGSRCEAWSSRWIETPACRHHMTVEQRIVHGEAAARYSAALREDFG